MNRFISWVSKYNYDFCIFCFVLFHFILFCFVLFCFILFYYFFIWLFHYFIILLFYIILLYFISYYFILFLGRGFLACLLISEHLSIQYICRSVHPRYMSRILDYNKTKPLKKYVPTLSKIKVFIEATWGFALRPWERTFSWFSLKPFHKNLHKTTGMRSFLIKTLWEVYCEKILMKTTKKVLSQGHNENPQITSMKTSISNSVLLYIHQ